MILVTGAGGYIGSHVCVDLIESGFTVIGLDNFSNSCRVVTERINKISNYKINILDCDMSDINSLRSIFRNNSIRAVIHLAALKSLSDSIDNPIKYYKNNIDSLTNLITIMDEFKCNKLVFSSSATVYCSSNSAPYSEDMILQPTNPYGWTKFICEKFLFDVSKSNHQFKFVALRYFNPVGAHKSGLIGEAPTTRPNNLMPLISNVALGTLTYLPVYGDKWPTCDGTGVRDYIHISDLSDGHIKSLNFLFSNENSVTINLGSGKGYSVLEVIKTFEKVSSKNIPYQIVNNRSGDVGISYADISKAKKILNWYPRFGLEEMCSDTWNWQIKNPNGYI